MRKGFSRDCPVPQRMRAPKPSPPPSSKEKAPERQLPAPRPKHVFNHPRQGLVTMTNTARRPANQAPFHSARLLGGVVDPTKRPAAHCEIARLYAWHTPKRAEKPDDNWNAST